MTELDQRKALMDVLLLGIKSQYGTYSARRIIIEAGKVQRLNEIPDDRVEAVIAECQRVIASLGRNTAPAALAERVATKSLKYPKKHPK